ncbi:MAG TPA: hypothetical protein V6D25_23215 [Leptolyngbyaceae cyanobacterium]
MPRARTPGEPNADNKAAKSSCPLVSVQVRRFFLRFPMGTAVNYSYGGQCSALRNFKFIL